MRRVIGIFFLVLNAAGGLAAVYLTGLVVGADLGMGNVLGNDYQFAGKADPVLYKPAGQGTIKPFIMYSKNIGVVRSMLSVSDQLGFDNPETTELNVIATGIFNLPLNNNTSIFTFTLSDKFALGTYDGKTAVSDGAKSWSNLFTPSVQFTQVFKFGGLYGKFSLPVYKADNELAKVVASQTGALYKDYEAVFIFGDFEVGVITGFGFNVWVSPVFQLAPDPEKTPVAAFDTYAADKAFQQMDFGVSFEDGPLSGSVVFAFPISGDRYFKNGIKDVGFSITPTFAYMANAHIQAFLQFEIANIAKDTGSSAADKINFSPTVGFSYVF
jgi:hypothetical protein